jgi:hypothetical protein
VSEQLTTPERSLTEAQVGSLQNLCERYGVEYRADDYFIYPADSFMMPGWAEGWVGGHEIQWEHPTIYVGCSPEGKCHS